MKAQPFVLVAGALCGPLALAAYAYSRLSVHDRERQELRAATRELQQRNDQLAALHNVFSEITETLTLHYVVAATLRETLKLMRCDMTVLRVLRGDELVVLGAQAKDGREPDDVPNVPLGAGPTGQAAKTGKTIRIDKDAEQRIRIMAAEGRKTASEKLNEAPLQSVIIVPLIVGARVVGTLAAWSRQVGSFGEEDEQIMEMMASQVATALVAADAMETSERHAHHDPLTDLPNRRQLQADLRGELESLSQNGRRAVVAMADIDHFKRLNDDFGHHVGDLALQKIASVLRQGIREGDLVYRYGGEEFLVVFMDVGLKEALALAERLRAAVESTPLIGEELEPLGGVKISIGLAPMTDLITDILQLIELADSAMYAAKATGRNRTAVWNQENDRPTIAAA